MPAKSKKQSSPRKGRRNLKGIDTGDAVKLQIAHVAKAHFARYGFDGASLNKIATEAKVANSLINYYFEDKNGLLDFCLKQFIDAHQNMLTEILREPGNEEELKVRLELFVRALTKTVSEDFEIAQIIRREMESNQIERMELVFNTMIKDSFQLAKNFFAKAQAAQLIRKDLKPEVLALLVFEVCTNACRKDAFIERLISRPISESEFREVMNRHIIDLFLEGIKP